MMMGPEANKQPSLKDADLGLSKVRVRKERAEQLGIHHPDGLDTIAEWVDELKRYGELHRFDEYEIDCRVSAASAYDYILGSPPDPAGNYGYVPVGYSGFRSLDELGEFHPDRASCIALVGERATHKSSIARNFALRAAVCGYHSVFITLSDRIEEQQFASDGFEFSSDIFWDNQLCVRDEYWKDADPAKPRLQLIEREQLAKMDGNERFLTRLGRHKVQKKYYAIDGHDEQYLFGSLAVLNFVPGVLLPEEFVAELLYEIGDDADSTEARQVKRVVIDDVSLIGASYPLLMNSPTCGGLFLTAVVDLLKSRDVQVMLVSSESEEPQCKLVTEKVVALADTVVKCRFYDVFGQRYVGVTGEKAKVAEGPTRMSAPGVIERVPGTRPNVIQINDKLLGGLIGFETGSIHRAGASLYLFEDGTEAHKQYNTTIETLLDCAFGQPLPALMRGERRLEPPPGPNAPRQVSVDRFSSQYSVPVHESLGVLQEKPLDRTVVMTFDEFWTETTGRTLENLTDFAIARGYINDHAKRKQSAARAESRDKNAETNETLIPLPHDSPLIEGIPYYGNVLLIAYRDADSVKEAKWSTWDKIWENAKAIRETVDDKRTPVLNLFDFDGSADETLACIFIDALLAACRDTALKTAHAAETKQVERDITKAKSGRAGDQGLQPLLRRRRLLEGHPLKTDMEMAEVIESEKDVAKAQYENWIDAQIAREMDSVRGALIKRALADFPEGASLPDGLLELFNDRLSRLGEQRYAEDAHLGPLRPDAAVYCCWYSHLRDLIRRYPQLGGELKVAPLPFGGFRGDWFLGIAKGSVSRELGEQIIEMLCMETEEYERFAAGVGLPASVKFRDGVDNRKQGSGPAPPNDRAKPNFLPWFGAKDVTLDRVLKIHQNALSRSSIPGYRHFRHVLVTLFRQVIGFRSPKRDAGDVLKVIGPQIRLMTGRATASEEPGDSADGS